jgi:hypothetical protein
MAIEEGEHCLVGTLRVRALETVMGAGSGHQLRRKIGRRGAEFLRGIGARRVRTH